MIYIMIWFSDLLRLKAWIWSFPGKLWYLDFQYWGQCVGRQNSVKKCLFCTCIIVIDIVCKIYTIYIYLNSVLFFVYLSAQRRLPDCIYIYLIYIYICQEFPLLMLVLLVLPYESVQLHQYVLNPHSSSSSGLTIAKALIVLVCYKRSSRVEHSDLNPALH